MTAEFAEPKIASRAPVARAALDAVLERRSVPTAYQPVFDLHNNEVIGFEALARPVDPTGAGAPVTIGDLLAAADEEGTLDELDWICRASVLGDPGVARLPRSLTWFVNSEPSALGSPCPPDLEATLAATPRDLRVVTEVTERAIDDDPIGLFRGIAAARRRGDGIAIDDVGVADASLALLPLVEPDVVKLDVSLPATYDERATLRVCGAVRSLTERRAVAVVAEGIERHRDGQVAQMFGATHGQGYLLGRAAPLPIDLPTPHRPLAGPGRPIVDDRTPFDLVAAERIPLRTSKELLVPMTSYIEQQVEERAEPLALFTSFEDDNVVTARVQQKYQDLAARYAFVAMFSSTLPDRLLGRFHATRIDTADSLRREWNVVVVGPHYAVALCARSLGDTGPDRERRFDYVLTHDRALVERAARALIARQIGAVRSGNGLLTSP